MAYKRTHSWGFMGQWLISDGTVAHWRGRFLWSHSRQSLTLRYCKHKCCFNKQTHRYIHILYTHTNIHRVLCKSFELSLFSLHLLTSSQTFLWFLQWTVLQAFWRPNRVFLWRLAASIKKRKNQFRPWTWHFQRNFFLNCTFRHMLHFLNLYLWKMTNIRVWMGSNGICASTGDYRRAVSWKFLPQHCVQCVLKKLEEAEQLRWNLIRNGLSGSVAVKKAMEAEKMHLVRQIIQITQELDRQSVTTGVIEWLIQIRPCCLQ